MVSFVSWRAWGTGAIVSVVLACACVGWADAAANVRLGPVSASVFGSIPPGAYKVPSGSMEPTLPVGTRVFLRKGAPFLGAIVVFHPPEGAERGECGPKPHRVSPGGAACDSALLKKSSLEFIKRVVAGPGDEIYVRAGHVYRKASGASTFVRERDPYIRACGHSVECDFPVPIRIPAGHWFLMGDNRGNSEDSRFWGPVPRKWIVGMATNLECPRFTGEGLTWVHRTWREGCASRDSQLAGSQHGVPIPAASSSDARAARAYLVAQYRLARALVDEAATARPAESAGGGADRAGMPWSGVWDAAGTVADAASGTSTSCQGRKCPSDPAEADDRG